MNMTHSQTGKGLLRLQLSELVINWHVTEACNYHCRYCYAHWEKRGREIIHNHSASTRMLQELWQHFSPTNLDNPLRRHMDWKGVRLNLAGGEPLLYPDFKDVPADKPYTGRSFEKKNSPKAKPHFSRAKDEERGEKPAKKRSGGGTPRIWQMDDADKPRRKTNGTTRTNTKSRGRRSR